MKIAIYQEHANGVAGGAEHVVAVMAEALSGDHTVDIIHHQPGLTTDALQTAYGTDVSRVELRYVPRDPSVSSWTNPVRRYRRERARYAEAGRGYDLYIASVFDVPPFCPAPRGALSIYFPYFDKRITWPWEQDGASLKRKLQRLYAEWEWRRRFGGYQVAMTCSKFSRDHLRQWWGVESEVVYAPASVEARDGGMSAKRDIILSVGRFTAAGTSKNQLELMTAFAGFGPRQAPGWTYKTVGGLSSKPDDHAYFAEVQAATNGTSAELLTSVSRAELTALYGEAKIFWHGAGLTAPNDPMCMEHFGIVTVEAMSAGCVPVVIARGGQPEIVEHGKNGFLWTTLEEMTQHTARLTNDPELLARMSAAARERAATFSKAAFVRRMTDALRPLLQ
jgi:glycosyltransferase involved in cell wall biosynthesis